VKTVVGKKAVLRGGRVSILWRVSTKFGFSGQTVWIWCDLVFLGWSSLSREGRPITPISDRPTKSGNAGDFRNTFIWLRRTRNSWVSGGIDRKVPAIRFSIVLSEMMWLCRHSRVSIPFIAHRHPPTNCCCSKRVLLLPFGISALHLFMTTSPLSGIVYTGMWSHQPSHSPTSERESPIKPKQLWQRWRVKPYRRIREPASTSIFLRLIFFEASPRLS
jgi:hypothetical protein